MPRMTLSRKIAMLAAIVPVAAVVVTGVSLNGTSQLKSQLDNMYGFMLVPIMNIGQANLDRAQIATDLVLLDQGSLPASDRTSLAAAVTAADATMTAIVKRYEDEWRSTLSPDFTVTLASQGKAGLQGTEMAALASFHTGYDAYIPIRDQLLAGKTVDPAALSTAMALLAKPLDDLVLVNKEFADLSNTGAQATVAASQLQLLLAALVVTAVGVLLAWRIARGITRSIAPIQSTVAMLADKCATWLAEGMEKLRDNDLTYDVQPVTPLIEGYGTDEIGQLAENTNTLRNKIVASIEAYNAAREGLASTITEVQEAADAVTRTSQQLNEAATQTGAATQQVATTISQVAGGTAEQARAASETNAAVQELSGVIDTVGRGAAETSRSVERSLHAVTSMQSALTASDKASDELKPADERAEAALVKVTNAIRENAEGMARIKTAVDQSAVKVAELGAKGEQIGAIVETIDDIAEQTNLLALNAAIEAARAGEMGKGFAVVADEVRKLAERSGRATKEIAQLIAEVQKGTTDAVQAMSLGAAEVETGLVVGRRSAESVVEIADAAKARDAALARVFAALSSIGTAATDVTASSDDIARVVHQTAAGATQMAASSDSVTRSISSIAAVSEENSAAAQEVSAATEEMSAQAEEVVASAATLADMASQLDALVARFVLANQAHAAKAPARSMPSTVAQRRRSADWTKVA